MTIIDSTQLSASKHLSESRDLTAVTSSEDPVLEEFSRTLEKIARKVSSTIQNQQSEDSFLDELLASNLVLVKQAPVEKPQSEQSATQLEQEPELEAEQVVEQAVTQQSSDSSEDQKEDQEQVEESSEQVVEESKQEAESGAETNSDLADKVKDTEKSETLVSQQLESVIKASTTQTEPEVKVENVVNQQILSDQSKVVKKDTTEVKLQQNTASQFENGQLLEQGKDELLNHNRLAPELSKLVADKNLNQKGLLNEPIEGEALNLDTALKELSATLNLQNVAIPSGREILQASTMLRQGGEHTSNLLNESSSSVKQTVIAKEGVVEGAQAKSRDADVARRSAPKLARALPREVATRTIQRVEDALKEAAKSRDGRTISLRLDPPSLGRVKVDVSFVDGQLNARIFAVSEQVTSLLRDRSLDLQASLRRLGLDVDQIAVSVNSDSQGSETEGDGTQDETADFTSTDTFEQQTLSNQASTESSVSQSRVDTLDHWVA